MNHALRCFGLSTLLLGIGLACDRAPENRPPSPAAPAVVVKAPCVMCKGHEIEVTAGTLRTIHQGKTYYFCSDHCKTAFEADPAKHASPATQPATRPS